MTRHRMIAIGYASLLPLISVAIAAAVVAAGAAVAGVRRQIHR